MTKYTQEYVEQLIQDVHKVHIYEGLLTNWHIVWSIIEEWLYFDGTLYQKIVDLDKATEQALNADQTERQLLEKSVQDLLEYLKGDLK